MPEGDTIFRAAETLRRALKGKEVVEFTTVFPQLARVDEDAPLRGRTIEDVRSVGKHLLIEFSGGLVLRTHMRMNGSWHIYRRGERWRRSRHSMRIVIATKDFEAVGFQIPVAEMGSAARMEQLQRLGPDLLSDAFDPAQAITRLRERPELEIADALLNQTLLSGIGNVFKSEILFVCRTSPFATVGKISDEALAEIVRVSQEQLNVNVLDRNVKVPTVRGVRTTTGRADPAARLWVYGRGGQPCRRCGTPISRGKQGPHQRSTYWCPKCQESGPGHD
jgi:endonuclease-8